MQTSAVHAARREAVILAGEMLRDRPDALWDVQSWAMTVTDEAANVLFDIRVEARASATVHEFGRG